MQANPQTWRDVDALAQDYNNRVAKDQLPQVTITHNDGQTEISETPPSTSQSLMSHILQDGAAVAGGAGTGALFGSIIGPEGTAIGAAIGGTLGAIAAGTTEVIDATAPKPKSVKVSSK